MPSPATHEPEVTLANVAAMIKDASASVADFNRRTGALEASVNGLLRERGRPGGNGLGESDDRAQALGLLATKHYATVTKHDGFMPEPSFTSEQISEAQLAIRGLRSLMHATSIDAVPHDQRKSLSAFSFGSQGFILAPEMSQQILSCLTDVTNLAGLVQNISISSSSIKFLVDNDLWDVAGWACDSSCFANNPTKNLGDGLGELEIKAESLRYVVCATRDLLEDSSVDIEQWMMAKVDRAFRHEINNSILTGDGFGRPMGVVNPAAAIPIMETSENTAPSQFTWQDLLMMKWSLPVEYQRDAVFLMNPHTMGLLMTMSDANGRPIMTPTPAEGAGYLLGGSPIVVAQQLPDVAPGALPVLYANLRELYMLVTRRAITMQSDPFSAGWCTLFKFDTRIGGGIVCPNAGRWLRIR